MLFDMIILWGSFWTMTVVGFVIMVIIHRKSQFFIRRTGQYWLAVGIGAAILGIVTNLPKDDTLAGVWIFVGLGLCCVWAAPMDHAFEAERYWKTREKRRIANRENERGIRLVPDERPRYGDNINTGDDK